MRGDVSGRHSLCGIVNVPNGPVWYSALCTPDGFPRKVEYACGSTERATSFLVPRGRLAKRTCEKFGLGCEQERTTVDSTRFFGMTRNAKGQLAAGKGGGGGVFDWHKT